MPKITKGGVSNRLVNPDFIAEPGTPVEVAMDTGGRDAGQPSEEQPETYPGKSLYADPDDPNRPGETDRPDDVDKGRDTGRPLGILNDSKPRSIASKKPARGK